MMTREDILRELELLPVWQLRVPSAESGYVELELKVEKLAEIQSIEVIAEKCVYEKPLSFSHDEAKPLSFSEIELESAELSDISATVKITYQYAASEDNAYLFIMPQDELSTEAATLQRNMWRAMRLNMQASVSQNLDAIDFAKHKIIITMGESVAQQLLASQAPLGELRGRVHKYQNISLVATFDAAYLLQNPQCKPQTWADLCLAMQSLSDLKLEK